MSAIFTRYFITRNKLKIAITFFISGLIVALGQPSWSLSLGVLSSLGGFALFWGATLQIAERKKRIYSAFIWFMAVEGVHLSWMTSTEYQGPYIYIVYTFLIAALAIQFAFLTDLLTREKSFSCSKILFISALWVLLEWIRLFFMSGFPFNPVGLTLTSTLWGKQWITLGGIYFLSFWVILTNCSLLRIFYHKKKVKNLIVFLGFALLPYLYGGLHVQYHQAKMKASPDEVQAILVQTALSPEEKTGMNGYDKMTPPLTQWSYIFDYLYPYRDKRVEVVVLPERSVPFADQTKLYLFQDLRSTVHYFFGSKGSKILDQIPRVEEVVDNRFISQFLADYFQAQVIVGLEYQVPDSDYAAYASAFSFRPQTEVELYHKRILLPIVEYLPFKWCEDLAKKYHIFGWYQRGKQPKVFSGPLAISPSICIEELYGGLIRKNRKLGCSLFVNLTNDVWFPNSKLPSQHFDHGSLRALENGTPLLRACNTGITAGVDALGRTVALLGSRDKSAQWERGALFVSIPKYQFTTPYLWYGNRLILWGSFLCIIFFVSINFLKKNKLLLIK